MSSAVNIAWDSHMTMQRKNKSMLAGLVAILILPLLSGVALAQDEFGNPDNFNEQPGEGFQNIQEAFQQGTLGALRDQLVIEPLDIEQEITIEPSLRAERGFVGPTAVDVTGQGDQERFSSGFVGRSFSQGGEFGGGINTGSGGQGGFGNARGGFGGFGRGGATNGFTVTRQNVRARLVPSFTTRRVSGQVVANRFQSRIPSLPAFRGTNGVSVNVQNGTAVMTGQVGSAIEAQMLERQLRLEPGVYRIENRTTVGF